MERLRTFTVTVEIDTNKQTYKRTFADYDYETREQMFEVAQEWATSQLNGMG